MKCRRAKSSRAIQGSSSPLIPPLVFLFATEPTMCVALPRQKPWFGMRDVPAPVNVEMISVRKLNVPLPSFALSATRTFSPATSLDVDVFTPGILSQRLMRAPSFRRDKRETAARWQLMFAQYSPLKLFLARNWLRSEPTPFWIALSHYYVYATSVPFPFLSTLTR
jgi:hypothetical protein